MKPYCVLVLLLLTSPALADVEIQFSDGGFGLVNDGRVMFGDDDSAVLFVPGDEGLIMISHEERSWTRLTPGFANTVANQMQAQMDEMLAGMPPEQRAMVEQQMSGMMPPKPGAAPKMSIRRTGNSDKVAGFDCDEAEIVYDDGTVEELVCVATADELDISDSDFEAIISAMEGMAEIAAMGGDSAPQLDLDKLGGIPVRTRARDESEDTEVVSVRTSRVDSARLEIPDGYREVPIEKMMTP